MTPFEIGAPPRPFCDASRFVQRRMPGPRLAPRTTRTVPEETAIAFSYEGAAYAVMMATPADLTDFAIGFSLTERIIRSPCDVETLETVSTVDGIMLREKPAANFFMGSYFAESLLLTETGASTGAIQIAGTDSDHQLPFFVTTCDYTLIGEELYAASAYLSREPVLVGTLRGQDIGKALIMGALILGTCLATLGVLLDTDGFSYLLDLFKDFK